MSSLAATQADGYYKPAAYFESGAYKKQSISKYNGSKGTNQSQTHGVVRFELPMHGVCLGCNLVVRKGTRFNAKKNEIGKYLSTLIYEFRFKCYECKGGLAVKNDPKMRDYEFFDGFRKQELGYDGTGDGAVGTYELGFSKEKGMEKEEEKKKRGGGGGGGGGGGHNDVDVDNGKFDPIASMIKREGDKKKQEAKKTEFDKLVDLKNATGLNDYDVNSKLRDRMRGERRKKRKRLEEGQGVFGEGSNLELLGGEELDGVRAREAMRGGGSGSRFKKIEKRGMLKLRSESIFGGGGGGGPKGKGKKVVTTKTKIEQRALELALARR